MTWGLNPEGRCFAHDPQRAAQAEAGRSRGGATTAAKHAPSAPSKYRVAREADLPTHPLEDVDAVIAWLVWLARLTVTGQVDPSTARETNKILVTLRSAFQLQSYQRRLRELEKLVSQYEKERRP